MNKNNEIAQFIAECGQDGSIANLLPDCDFSIGASRTILSVKIGDKYRVFERDEEGAYRAWRTEWDRLDAMTAEEKHAAALANPDCQPLTEEDFASGRLKRIKRADPETLFPRNIKLTSDGTRTEIPEITDISVKTSEPAKPSIMDITRMFG